MLQQPDVPGHERRRGESEDLPEGKIPRHHRQDDTERLVEHEAFAVLRANVALGQVRFGILCVVPARGRALGRLFHSGPNGLAHLQGHQATELRTPRLEQVGRFHHDRGPLGEGGPAPPIPRLPRLGYTCLDLRFRVGRDRRERFASRRVDGRKAHGASRFACVRRAASARLQSAMRVWSPDSSTSGTACPRNTGGRV